MTPAFIINHMSSEKQWEKVPIGVQRILHPRIANRLGCAYTRTDVFDLDASSSTCNRPKWASIKTSIASSQYASGYCFRPVDRYHCDKAEWFELLVSLLRFNISVAMPDTNRTSFGKAEEIRSRRTAGLARIFNVTPSAIRFAIRKNGRIGER